MTRIMRRDMVIAHRDSDLYTSYRGVPCINNFYTPVLSGRLPFRELRVESLWHEGRVFSLKNSKKREHRPPFAL